MRRIEKKVTVGLPLWLYETLKQEAEESNWPLTSYIRRILWIYAERE